MVWAGSIEVAGPPYTTEAWVTAAPAALLAVLSFGLFAWSAATMGANWSLVARTRADHQLVQSGPFRWMRHPIYIALFGLMIATALALGRVYHLAIAIPLYALGTWSRVNYEEALLRERFGAAYDAYAQRVKRYLPGVF